MICLLMIILITCFSIDQINLHLTQLYLNQLSLLLPDYNIFYIICSFNVRIRIILSIFWSSNLNWLFNKIGFIHFLSIPIWPRYYLNIAIFTFQLRDLTSPIASYAKYCSTIGPLLNTYKPTLGRTLDAELDTEFI